MMSLRIIDTDHFMDLPLSAQCLYFHMVVRADDDGFLGKQKKIMRMLGANEDDLFLLQTRGFVIPFDTGVCVITHWRVHNLIRSDRYNETIYKDEKELLVSYQSTYQMAPQGRLVKGRVGKGRVGKGNNTLLADGLRDSGFDLFWKTYPRKVKKAEAQTAWMKHKADRPPIDEIVTTIEAWSKADDWTKDNGQFIPYPASWINSRRWEDELPLIPETEDEEIKRIFG